MPTKRQYKRGYVKYSKDVETIVSKHAKTFALCKQGNVYSLFRSSLPTLFLLFDGVYTVCLLDHKPIESTEKEMHVLHYVKEFYTRGFQPVTRYLKNR